MSNPYDKTRDTNSSVLGPTLKFKGELTADEDLLIQGQVAGTIKHSSSLTIGEGGSVKADVAAEYIVVEGRVKGDLKGSKCVKIRQSAKIDGNVISPSVSLVEGATFNGKIDMDTDPMASKVEEPEEKQSEEVVAKETKAPIQKRPVAKKQERPAKKSADAA
ncbi:MAG: bactofilin family protein [Gammaproteobacteria bacterium]